MKEKLLAEIQCKEMKKWGLATFMDYVNTQTANIVQRQAALKQSLEMEVVAAVSNLLLKAARRCVDDRAASDEAHIGALHIQIKLIAQRARLQSMAWLDFQLQTAHLLSSHLPLEQGAEQQAANPTTKGIMQTLALAAEAGNRHLQGALNRILGWTCEKCGQKGHRRRECKNPPNPNAQKLVQEAKAEAAKKRKERMSKLTQRDRINKQQKTESASAVNNNTANNAPKGQVVQANFSWMEPIGNGGSNKYSSCAMAVTHAVPKQGSSAIMLALISGF
jgi:hypothetical protein